MGAAVHSLTEKLSKKHAFLDMTLNHDKEMTVTCENMVPQRV